MKPVLEPLVTIIIPNWNGQKWLPQCLAALNAQTFQAFETIIVDNGSTDQSVRWINKHYPRVNTILLHKNHGFAYAVNQGINRAHTSYICLLNNDTIPDPNWLKALYNTLDNADKSVGGVGSMMLSLDDRSIIDDAGNDLSWYLSATKVGHGEKITDHHLNTNPFSISGGASIFRTSFFEDCGSFDESFFAYLEDIDLGLRGNLYGYKFQICPSATILHKSHGSEIPKNTYVRLVTANRLALLVKNIPTFLILKNLPRILYGQVYFFIAYGKPISSLKGYVNFLGRFFSIIRDRKIILNNNKLSNSEILNLLNSRPNTPPLSHFLMGYFRGIKRLFVFR